MKTKLQVLKRVALASAIGVVAASAHAAGPTFDITPVTEAITAAITAIAAIGAAMLGFYAIKKAWSMIRP